MIRFEWGYCGSISGISFSYIKWNFCFYSGRIQYLWAYMSPKTRSKQGLSIPISLQYAPRFIWLLPRKWFNISFANIVKYAMLWRWRLQSAYSESSCISSKYHRCSNHLVMASKCNTFWIVSTSNSMVKIKGHYSFDLIHIGGLNFRFCAEYS